MEEFKRKHFESEHPGVPFPEVRGVSAPEVLRIRAGLGARLGRDAGDGLAIVQQLAARSVLVKKVDAESGDFDVVGTLWSHQIRPLDKVYLNWYRFDSLDEMAVRNLARYFADIWYPSSDDLDIFDGTLDWVLSVGHSGDVRIARLGMRSLVGRKP